MPPTDPPDTLPPDRPVTLDQHDRAIVSAVLAGDAAPWEWAAVPCGRVVLTVSRDVLRVRREGVLVRVGVSPPLAQALADHWACVLSTPRMVDAIFAAAPLLVPQPQWKPGADIAAPTFEVAHSTAIDTAIARLPQAAQGLLGTLGKDWVLCKRLWALARTNLHRVNYGWPYTTERPQTYPAVSNALPDAPRSWVIQPPGEAHNDAHRDYSQTFRAVQRACLFDGEPADVAELLTGPNAGELSLEGPLPGARLPALPAMPLASLV